MRTVSPDSPDLTIFIKNFQDRGSENYLKKVYMTALRTNNMPKYEEKMDSMLNEVYTAITVNRKPFLSTFKEALIRFFLDIHVGEDEYPEVVLEYFRLFMQIIGFGDPTRPGRNEAMIFGNTHVKEVKEYFAQRLVKIIQDGDDTTYLYYWHLAGLPKDSILIEAVHNIVAFSQYANTMYRLIADKIWATTAPPNPIPPPPTPFPGPQPYWWPICPIPVINIPAINIPANAPDPAINLPAVSCGPVNFFNKMSLAASETDQIDVAREVYRLLAPNTNSFSKLVFPTADPNVDTDLPYTQSRHIWQQIMIGNQPLSYVVPSPLPPPYDKITPATYKTATYFQYKGDSTQPNYLYTGFGATYAPSGPPIPPPVSTFDPSTLFTLSGTDNNALYGDGTVLQLGNPNIIPVLSTPLYLPKGMAYRRCAGEIQNYYFITKAILKFKDLNWKVLPLPSPPDYNKYITVGPFTAYPDNIFVDM